MALVVLVALVKVVVSRKLWIENEGCVIYPLATSRRLPSRRGWK